MITVSHLRHDNSDLRTARGVLHNALLGLALWAAGCLLVFGLWYLLVASAHAQTVTLAPSATQGNNVSLQASLTNTATAIKTSGGTLSKLLCYNPNAAVAYVQLYNLASGSVTVGTTTPVESIPIAATLNGGFAQTIGDLFSTAITAAATTTATGGTAPSTALTCNFGYK